MKRSVKARLERVQRLLTKRKEAPLLNWLDLHLAAAGDMAAARRVGRALDARPELAARLLSDD
jgi:hypothetical protein